MDYTGRIRNNGEINKLTPSYGGISYDRIEKEGLTWPCPTPDHPGTPVLHMQGFARGKGAFFALSIKRTAELPDAEYPFILTTGRSVRSALSHRNHEPKEPR